MTGGELKSLFTLSKRRSTRAALLSGCGGSSIFHIESSSLGHVETEIDQRLRPIGLPTIFPTWLHLYFFSSILYHLQLSWSEDDTCFAIIFITVTKGKHWKSNCIFGLTCIFGPFPLLRGIKVIHYCRAAGNWEMNENQLDGRNTSRKRKFASAVGYFGMDMMVSRKLLVWRRDSTVMAYFVDTN